MNDETGITCGRVARSSRIVLVATILIGGTVACSERATNDGAPTVATIAPSTAPAIETSANPVPSPITSPAGPAAGDNRAPTVAAFESRYITEALQQGMGHVALAQYASVRSESQAVDALARQIITTHNDINATVARIAAANSVPLPADAAERFRQAEQRLRDLDGRNLDASYLASILELYPPLIELHARAATNATNMDLKESAVLARSALTTNLLQARAAYSQVTGIVPPMTPKAGSPPPAGGTTG